MGKSVKYFFFLKFSKNYFSQFLDRNWVKNVINGVNICSSIHDSLVAACPKIVQSKFTSPWGNAELHDMMAKLRKDPNNRALQIEIREKRKWLKDSYYNHKALEINCAVEARQVEKEFQLAKTFSMHKSSSKIDISKERLLELPPE